MLILFETGLELLTFPQVFKIYLHSIRNILFDWFHVKTGLFQETRIMLKKSVKSTRFPQLSYILHQERPQCTIKTDISPGLTPEIRDACPRVSGLNVVNFSLASFFNPIRTE